QGFLQETVDTPAQRGADHQQHAERVVREGQEELVEAIVEEKQQSTEKQRGARPLQAPEGFPIEEHTAAHQDERRQLYHYLRRLGIEQVEAVQVQHEIPCERHDGDGQHAIDLPAERLRRGQAAVAPEKEEDQQGGGEEADPGNGQGVHRVEQQVQKDRQHAPHERRGQGKQKSVPV